MQVITQEPKLDDKQTQIQMQIQTAREQMVLIRDIPNYISEMMCFNSSKARMQKRNIKRAIAQLSFIERCTLVFRLITYMYILPIVRISIVGFVLTFQFYNFIYPNIISPFTITSSSITTSKPSARLIDKPIITESSKIASSIGTLKPHKTKIKINNDVQIKPLKPSAIAISSFTLNGKQSFQYTNYSHLPISTKTRQIAFDGAIYDYGNNGYGNNDYSNNGYSNNKKLLKPHSNIPKPDKLDLHLAPQVKKSIPIPAPAPATSKPTSKPKPAPAKTKPTLAPAKIKPKANKNIKSNQCKMQTQSQQQIHPQLNNRQQSSKHIDMRDDDDDFIYGYVLVDKKIAVVIEDGKTKVYKVSQNFIDKFLENSKK